MPTIPISKLKKLVKTEDIEDEWNSYKDKNVIHHPDHGFISPNTFRKMCIGEECQYCQTVMTGNNDGTQVTLDHVINKARHPELLFDYRNLEAICKSCNSKKGDDNTFTISQVVKQRDQKACERLIKFSKI